jgi:hypothetical protein
MTLMEGAAKYLLSLNLKDQLVLVKPTNSKDQLLYESFRQSFLNLPSKGMRPKLIEISVTDVKAYVKKGLNTYFVVPTNDKSTALKFINTLNSCTKNFTGVISVLGTKEWVNFDEISGEYKNKYNFQFPSPNDFNYSYESIISNAPSIFENSLYEWLSYATFSMMRSLSVFGADPVYWTYIYHFLLTAVLFFWIFKTSNCTLVGIILVTVLYAPLFSFVLLRAAPAYLLIALSVFYCAHRMKKTSSALAFIAVLYHITAILPAAVIVLLNILGFRLLKFSNLFFKIGTPPQRVTKL